jgi:hypothetical protein
MALLGWLGSHEMQDIQILRVLRANCSATDANEEKEMSKTHTNSGHIRQIKSREDVESFLLSISGSSSRDEKS